LAPNDPLNFNRSHTPASAEDALAGWLRNDQYDQPESKACYGGADQNGEQAARSRNCRKAGRQHAGHTEQHRRVRGMPADATDEL